MEVKKVVLFVGALISVLLVIALYLYIYRGTTKTVTTVTPKASVSVVRVGDIGFKSSFEVIGTVEAVSEAQLQNNFFPIHTVQTIQHN